MICNCGFSLNHQSSHEIDGLAPDHAGNGPMTADSCLQELSKRTRELKASNQNRTGWYFFFAYDDKNVQDFYKSFNDRCCHSLGYRS